MSVRLTANSVGQTVSAECDVVCLSRPVTNHEAPFEVGSVQSTPNYENGSQNKDFDAASYDNAMHWGESQADQSHVVYFSEETIRNGRGFRAI
jgi:hypothetical protein